MSDIVWAIRKAKNTSPNIAWSVCDGCEKLHVKDWEMKTCGQPRILDGVRRHPYYCDALRRDLSKQECYTVECPEGRKAKR